MNLEEMSRSERSLLLYLESRSVNFIGKVDSANMNREDFDVARRWKQSGFINFGRIDLGDTGGRVGANRWVRLSDLAWELAHKERRNRAERTIDKYPYDRKER